MLKYHINLFYSEDDEGYIAYMPDFEYCSAFGDTPQEALEELMALQAMLIDEAKERGEEMPEPQYKCAKARLTWDDSSRVLDKIIAGLGEDAEMPTVANVVN